MAYELLGGPAAAGWKASRPLEATVDKEGHNIPKWGKFPPPCTQSALGDNLLKGELESWVAWEPRERTAFPTTAMPAPPGGSVLKCETLSPRTFEVNGFRCQLCHLLVLVLGGIRSPHWVSVSMFVRQKVKTNLKNDPDSTKEYGQQVQALRALGTPPFPA